MRYQITCVNETKGVIVSVGCWDGTNQSTMTEQDVINKIAKGDIFYTWDYNLKKSANVEVWHFKSTGREFIKTAADCTVNNNLDNLRRCS
jgi:hypothetical protein